MKKKFLTMFSTGIAAVVGLSALFGACSKDNGKNEKKNNTVTPTNTITDTYDRGELTNTLHKVNVTQTSRTFVSENGGKKTTQYSILVNSDSAKAKRAASFISKYLAEATGADFAVVTHTEGDDLALTSADKYIIIGCEDLFAQAKLTMPTDENGEDVLGPAGYYVKTWNDSVFLMTHMSNGYQMGAIAFLKAVVGYDMIADDTVVFENEGETLPDLDIIERPDYDYRNYTNWMSDEGKYGMGYGYESIFTLIGSGKKGVHNSLEYVPYATYSAEHPEWYSNATTAANRQICYTAHGDQEAYEELLNTVVGVAVDAIIAQPEQSVITFTSEDNYVSCDCDACTAVAQKDGSISATVIRFINDLDDKLQAALQEYAEENNTTKREVQLAFFAYQAYVSAPTTSVADDPTLKCNKDVAVFIAPINAKYVYSFYDEENSAFAQQVISWTQYADNIIAWVYEADYHHYMFPYNTYSSMVDTYYFFKQNGANIIYNEGQRNNDNVTCFGKLKEYLDAKAQIDVTISYEEYKTKFFKNYYGAAAEIMEEYYNQIREWETYLESVNDYGLGGGVYQEIGSESRFWPKELLEGWIELLNQAYEKIAYLEVEEPALYTKLVKHIKIETLFPRYALCTLHESSYTASQIKELRIAFKTDADALGVTEQMEHGYITDIYARWGID